MRFRDRLAAVDILLSVLFYVIVAAGVYGCFSALWTDTSPTGADRRLIENSLQVGALLGFGLTVAHRALPILWPADRSLTASPKAGAVMAVAMAILFAAAVAATVVELLVVDVEAVALMLLLSAVVLFGSLGLVSSARRGPTGLFVRLLRRRGWVEVALHPRPDGPLALTRDLPHGWVPGHVTEADQRLWLDQAGIAVLMELLKRQSGENERPPLVWGGWGRAQVVYRTYACSPYAEDAVILRRERVAIGACLYGLEPWLGLVERAPSGN